MRVLNQQQNIACLSAAGGLAFFADGAALLNFVNVVDGGGDFAGGLTHVDRDRADLFCGTQRGIGQVVDITAGGNHKAVHCVADHVGLFMDRLCDLFEQSFEFGQVEFGVVFDRDEVAERCPACLSFGFLTGGDPFASQFDPVTTLGCHCGDHGATMGDTVGFAEPATQVCFRHATLIGDQAGEVLVAS